jgi:hypothetical protein
MVFIVVRKWLEDFGHYDHGKRKGNLVPSEAPPLPTELNIHEHYCQNEDSLSDPNINKM